MSKRRRMPGGMGGGNMAGMMQQVQQMQAEMEKAKAEIDETIFEATAGGGAVTAKVTGAKTVESIEIDPDILDPEDADILADMITAAVNEALKKAEDEMNDKMGALTGGMNIPGL